MDATPNGVSKPPEGTIATPSKPTKCDGPTSTDGSNAPLAKQAIGVCGDGPGIHQSRVRCDERDEVAFHIVTDGGQMAVDGRRQLLGRPRIPCPGNRRPPHARTAHRSTFLPAAFAVWSMLAFAMPAGITREDVIAIAALAELDLEPVGSRPPGPGDWGHPRLRRAGAARGYNRCPADGRRGCRPRRRPRRSSGARRWIRPWHWPMPLNRSLRAASSRFLA